MAAPARPDDARREAMRAGLLLGWLSVLAVVVAVALGVPARHPEAAVALAVAAGVANAAMGLVPWSRVLGPWFLRARLDLWAGGLLVFVAALIVLGGAQSRFDLLLFLVLPFIAVTHEGRRLAAWLAAAAATFAAALAVAPGPLSAAEVALHAVLLAASVLLALSLARATREHAAAAARAAAAAELEQALLAEAHHRIKNSLQTVADLLLLGRPDGADGAAFDATAGRIRSIAAVHHLLAGERGGTVAAGELLRTVVGALAARDAEVVVVADEVRLSAARAQQLGVIANELVANALRHGRPPVTVVLAAERGAGEGRMRLEVRDAGAGGRARTAEEATASAARPRDDAASAPTAGARRPASGPPAGGLGLTLVRQIAERGLGGEFALAPHADGSTRAVLCFDVADADPDR